MTTALDELITRYEETTASSAPESRFELDELRRRLEAAESRAAQLETDNDEMQSYINEIRVALHTEKDELTIEAVRRVIFERDELARKLEQAHNREQMNLAMMTEASAKIEELRQEARDSARRIVELLDSVQA